MADYESLTTCQLTNAFRAREKEVLYQMRQMLIPWTKGIHVNRKLYINRASRVLSGALGSWGFWYGRYLYLDPILDASWDEQGKLTRVQSDGQLREAAFDVSAFGAVASRVGSSYGDMTLTGFHLLLLYAGTRSGQRMPLLLGLLALKKAIAALFHIGQSLRRHRVHLLHPPHATNA
ncbi:hypothetical protein C3747_100g201 [Trypanosoma cruzi]|uniref:Uncharacterized protein n=1 Tax=Trypanosoma cruzi TaxID=5693 RepID=A0A2V2WIQ9_TRYCR|nr:hypothetical protein C3747_100g201 [Trypanosoma cruzi]